MRAAVADIAGADRGQGLAQPDGRVAAGPRPWSSERDQLLLGVLVALLLAADLLRRPLRKRASSEILGWNCRATRA
ncbi:hypothetical protein [Streptomyces mirabilis]|uniref:hypothetical protein n=1 Tax=Streptomyces mirabilis TaxID=68239 RepID=UPI0036A8DFFA